MADTVSKRTSGYNSANMLLTRGVNTYTNDANGNTLTGGGRTNTWDSANRLVQCVNGSTTSTFTYAADGIRHRSVVNGTTTDFVLDASMFVRELRGGSAYATYLMGPRGPEYRRDDVAGTVRWYLYDGLGSVLGEVDPNGSITASRKYDVYGAIRSGDSGTSAHKFVGSLGHPSEDNTGLIYMQARYMDPVTGRFVSEDPAGHGVNWYRYCRSSPINLRDANGKEDGGVAEELSADSEMSSLGADEGSAPSQLLYSTEHAIDELVNWFSRYAGRAYNIHDINDVLDLWNAGMAEMSTSGTGSWVLRTKFYNAVLILVAADDGDGIGRLVTAYSPFD